MRFLKSHCCARVGGGTYQTYHLICPQRCHSSWWKPSNWHSNHPLSASSSAVVECACLSASAGLNQSPSCHCHDTSISSWSPSGLFLVYIHTNEKCSLPKRALQGVSLSLTQLATMKIEASHSRCHTNTLPALTVHPEQRAHPVVVGCEDCGPGNRSRGPRAPPAEIHVSELS